MYAEDKYYQVPDEAPITPVMECDQCGKPIYAGDDYYSIDGWTWCERCISRAIRTA